jgi:hypothetical protein
LLLVSGQGPNGNPDTLTRSRPQEGFLAFELQRIDGIALGRVARLPDLDGREGHCRSGVIARDVNGANPLDLSVILSRVQRLNDVAVDDGTQGQGGQEDMCQESSHLVLDSLTVLERIVVAADANK